MIVSHHDKVIISELAAHYGEVALSKENKRRIELIRAHNARRTHKVPMLGELGLWNKWLAEMFQKNLVCRSQLARDMEANLKFKIYAFHEFGDDRPIRPFYSINPVMKGLPVFGIEDKKSEVIEESNAYHIEPVINSPEDFNKIKKPALSIDEEATQERDQEAQELVDGKLAVDLCRGPFLRGWNADISFKQGHLLGIENIMVFPLDFPEEFHALTRRMSEGVRETLLQNEKEGNVSRSASFNQSEPYFDDIPDPLPNIHNCQLRSLASFFASQEYTLISPSQYREFLFNYQKPIMELYGHVTYGCCENLTHKIDILKEVKSLHTIGVAPSADLEKCALQIGTDYCLSWRPSPTDTVCWQFDPQKTRELLKKGLEILSGSFAHIMLKDVETVQGQPDRIKRFFDIAHDEAEKSI